jgi:hypothetical protein
MKAALKILLAFSMVLFKLSKTKLVASGKKKKKLEWHNKISVFTRNLLLIISESAAASYSLLKSSE